MRMEEWGWEWRRFLLSYCVIFDIYFFEYSHYFSFRRKLGESLFSLAFHSRFNHQVQSDHRNIWSLIESLLKRRNSFSLYVYSIQWGFACKNQTSQHNCYSKSYTYTRSSLLCWSYWCDGIFGWVVISNLSAKEMTIRLFFYNLYYNISVIWKINYMLLLELSTFLHFHIFPFDIFFYQTTTHLLNRILFDFTVFNKKKNINIDNKIVNQTWEDPVTIKNREICNRIFED